jgi:Raf kinase inhibitor-like YbhB/YbcL family protein
MMRFVLAAALAVAAIPAFAMDLKSSDVADGKSFDTKFVCAKYSGSSISPALSWTDVPATAKSLAVTMFDPDAPHGGHWHWMAIDIPIGTTGLKQGAGAPKAMPAGSMQLPNGAGHANYDGACPPVGPAHHYEITLYAMPDATTAIPPDTGPAGVGALLTKTAIATAQMTPIYGK